MLNKGAWRRLESFCIPRVYTDIKIFYEEFAAGSGRKIFVSL